MADRFERLFGLPNNLYSSGSPVIVAAGALLRDTQSGNVIVQLKFHNVSAFPIRALKVSIDAFDAAGEKVEGVKEYQYLDLYNRSGDAFGSNKAIVMPSAVTRSFAICGMRVVLDNNTIQDVSIPLSALPQTKSLQSVFGNAELVKQYRFATNEKAASVPQEVEVIWQCACGEWNGLGGCTTCGASKTTVFSSYNPSALTEKMNERLKAEEAEQKAKAEREQIAAEEEAKRLADKAEKNKAAMKKVKLATAIIIPIIAVILLFSLWLYPDVILPSAEYQEAQELLSGGQYDEAIVAFTALGDYKDSAEMVFESLYQKANGLLDEQKYDDAISLFESLDGYSNSTDRINEANYQKALYLSETGNIEDAITILESLGSYAESSSNLEVLNYQYAGMLLDQGSYDEAKAVYQGIISYEDSSDMVLECDYRKAVKSFEDGDYEESHVIFLQISGYKDAEDQARRSEYLLALAKMETAHYSEAITLLEELGDYEDAVDQLIESKYQLAKQYVAHSDGYDSAKLLFAELGEYKDSATYLQLISETKSMVFQCDDNFQYWYLWVRLVIDVENCSLKIIAQEARSNDYLSTAYLDRGEQQYKIDYVWKFEQWKYESGKYLMVREGTNPSEDRSSYSVWTISGDWASVQTQTMLYTGEILGDPGEYLDHYIRITDVEKEQKAIESFQNYRGN